MLKVAVVEDETDPREEICEFLALSGMAAHGMGGGAEHDFIAWRVAAPGRPVSRADLLGAPLSIPVIDLRRKDAVVRRLRRKVEEDIALPLPVRAVHGVWVYRHRNDRGLTGCRLTV